MGLDLEAIEAKRIPIGKSLSGRLAKRGEPRLFLNVSHYLKRISDNMEPYYSGSMASTPLVFNKHVIGLLNICRPAPSTPLSREELNGLVTYGSQTSFAITSQQLVDKRAFELKEAQEALLRANEQLRKDITARVRAEEELRESEERYRSIVENSHSGVALVGDDFRFIYVNNELCRILGRPQEEIRGHDFREFLDDESRDLVTAYYRRRQAGEKVPVRYEFNVVALHGKIRRVEISATVIRDTQGRVKTIAQILDITERVQAEEGLKQSFARLQRALEGTIHALAATAEMRDPYTAGHQRQVADLICAIAEEMGLPADEIEGIRMAGLVHDIGKMSVPAEILSKPSELSKTEMDLIKAHPQVGYDILKEIDFPWAVAKIVLQHHERMDGSGYPQGLKGDEILLEARILAVADVVEAMASHRPYRPALGIEMALEEVSKNKGSLYDPDVVDACLELFTKKRFEFK
jgi:PAS domain S-box-containing protein/putative nucleotidyltransferase with HDIG domain